MRQKRILCVEDHPETCELITAVLDDHKVVFAESLQGAVEKIRSQVFNLFILNYNLPDGDGLELCHRIRMVDKETPIVFMTTYSTLTEEDVQRAGATTLVRKGWPDFTDALLEGVEHTQPPQQQQHVRLAA
jgi:CheY-like chemotaxis protein